MAALIERLDEEPASGPTINHHHYYGVGGGANQVHHHHNIPIEDSKTYRSEALVPISAPRHSSCSTGNFAHSKMVEESILSFYCNVC